MIEAAASPASPTSDRELQASLLIAAPPEQVFAAFLDPERLAHWWGPRGFRNTFAECDPRPGGRWRFVMHAPDGRDFPNECVAPEGDRTRVGWVQRFEAAAVRERLRPLAGPGNQQNLERLEAEVLAAEG